MEITDQIIIDKLTIFRHNSIQLNTCRLKETWLKDHGLYDYLMNRFKSVSNIQEIIYRIYYKIPDNYLIKCKTCGKEIPLQFKGFLLGYNQYCSYKCSLNDPCKIHKLNNVKQKEDINDDYVLNLMIKDNRLISEYCKVKKLKQFGIYNYLMNRYDDLQKSRSIIQEIIYRMKYHIDKSPVCPTCGKYVKFYRFSEGFRHYCSNECANKNENNVKQKLVNKHKTIESKWLKRGYEIRYSDNKNEFIIYNQCRIHNPFSIKNYTFFNRYQKDIVMCPICNPERNMETSIEYKIRLLLEKHNIKFEQHVRYIISPREFDFYLPDYKVAIECNGIYWHCGINGKNRFKSKYKLLEETNNKEIQMLTFWEDDIHYKINKIENIILRTCHLEQKIFSNNCTINQIDEYTGKNFINNYHIYNYIESDIRLGLFKDDELLCCMTFSRESDSDYILNQICYKNNLYVIGCEKLLLDYFKCNYKYNSIIFKFNLEYDNKKLYEMLNFKIKSDKIKFILKYYNYKRSNFRFNKDTLKDFLNQNKDDKRDDYLKCYSPYILLYKKED